MVEHKTIWIINQLTYLPEDGPHIRAYALGKHLAQKGYQVIIFAGNVLHFSGSVIDTGDKLYALKERDSVQFLYIKCHEYCKNDIHRILNIASYYHNVFKVAPEVERIWGKPDVIVGSTLYPTCLRAGIKLAKRYGVGMISETRDIIPDGFQSKSIFGNHVVRMACDYMMRELYEKSDALVFTMSGGRNYIIGRGWDVEHGGRINLESVHYINNGVDLRETRKNEELYLVPDPDLDDHNTFTVVYFGAIRFMNQMPLFVETAEFLKAAGRNDIKVLLWGAGTKLDETKAALERRGLDNIILKGPVPKREIPGIAKRSDLFILTANLSSVSKYGASPNKLFDYFAAGKPIIVPAILSDSLIQSNGAGVEIDRPTGEVLAREIIRFADMDQKEYDAYCEASSRMAKRFDYAKLANDAEMVIREVIQRVNHRNMHFRTKRWLWD